MAGSLGSTVQQDGKYNWVSFPHSCGKIRWYVLIFRHQHSNSLSDVGIPLQFTTDCGSETTQLFGLVSALRYVHVSSLRNLSYVFVILQQNFSSRVRQQCTARASLSTKCSQYLNQTFVVAFAPRVGQQCCPAVLKWGRVRIIQSF